MLGRALSYTIAASLALTVMADASSADAATKKGVTYYASHPCAALTQAQAKTALGAAVGKGKTVHMGTVECLYSTTGIEALTYSFIAQSLSAAKTEIKATTPEPKVGKGAACSTSNDTLFAQVQKKGSWILEVVANNCTAAAAAATYILKKV